MSKLRENYDQLKKEKETVNKSKDQIEKNLKDVSTKSAAQITNLQAQFEEAQEKITKLEFKIEEMKSQLNELENERANHQKLINEYGKLEQRFEKVRTELLRFSKNQQQQQQQQNLASNGSLSSSATSFNQHTSELESLIEELEQDSKMSVNSSSSTTSAAEINNGVANFEANKLLYMTSTGSEMDVSLISKLNRRIASLEMEKKTLQTSNGISRGTLLNGINEQDNNNNINDLTDAEKFEKIQQEKDYEMIKSQELEFENQKLKEDLSRLRDFVSENQQTGRSESNINKEMINQFDALNEEVQRRREECIQLKSLLIAKHRSSFNNNDNLENKDDLDDISSLNTDGNEFEVGYNTQKILNRILENQMFEIKRSSENEKISIQKEMKQLREENERQQSLLMQNLSPESLAEATYKNEIIKLADNNLVSFLGFKHTVFDGCLNFYLYLKQKELSEKCERYAEEVKKYKKMLKIYMKRSKTSKIDFDQFFLLGFLITKKDHLIIEYNLIS